MNLHPSRRLAAGLGAVAAAAGVTAAVAFASAPAASAATSASSSISSSTGTSSTGTSSDERCELALPGYVIGDPHLTAGSASGLRVWHDVTGWHVRATHPGTGSVVFTGVVHSGQPITAHRYRLEAGDQIGFSRDRHTMTFRFVNHGAVDGIDFTDNCAVHTGFGFQRAGSVLPAGAVYLGAQGAHPGVDPFTVYRHKP
jgi:hypothetical protein